jgi:hypothetical protein
MSLTEIDRINRYCLNSNAGKPTDERKTGVAKGNIHCGDK